MMKINELDRVISRSHNGKIDKYGWIIKADLGENASDKVEKILEVVRIIIEHNSDSWPDDADWDSIMPVWIQEEIPKLLQKNAKKY